LNFKLYLLVVILLVGCGVKSFPSAPKGTELPSILAPYLEETSKENIEIELEQADLENSNEDNF
jgi:hypothetical protein